MTAFAAHMHALAKDFIGTVLFVDDQFDDQSSSTNMSCKTTADVNQQTETPLENAAIDVGVLQEPEKFNAPGGSRDDDHVLKIKKLSQAFSANDILCSPIYTEPISSIELQDTFVAKVCRLANKADVIVLDWQMEVKEGSVDMGTTAQRIIAKYKSDNLDRDILVCIFTAEEAGKVQAEELSGDNVKVFYVFKKDGYDKLPDRIFSEFAKRHEGLLPSAALSAIKVIRDNTHRFLSLYSSEHDPAYLSHRCLLSRPEDAEIFATELMAATLEDLMRGNEGITNNLNSDILKAWVNDKCKDFEEKDFPVKKFETAKINNTERQKWLEIGIVQWMHSNLKANQGVDEKKKKTEIENWERNIAKGVAEYFVKAGTAADEFIRQSAFAKLTAHAFADAVNNNAATFLSLGSILKNSSDEYFLCIQPLCDSVRIKSHKKFLFLKLERKLFDITDNNSKTFHLIVNDIDHGEVYLKISEEISTIENYWFSATPGNDKVILKISESITGKLSEAADVDFTFLAQLRTSKAQKIAMSFLHQITRVGLDESEWLRRHGTV